MYWSPTAVRNDHKLYFSVPASLERLSVREMEHSQGTDIQQSEMLEDSLSRSSMAETISIEGTFW